MIDAAHASGADAVKFQKRNIRALFTEEGYKRPYGGKNSFGPSYGLHREALELHLNELAALKKHAESLGLVFFASVWDLPSLHEILSLDVDLIKIPSADLVNLQLLRRAAEAGVPLVLSTGMSESREIDAAVSEVMSRQGDVVLLHCNSSYPCPDEETAVRAMDELQRRYGLPTGYSGHEQGLGPSLAAVARGACMVERHFTLDKNLPGTDHKASLTPDEFSLLASLTREIEAALLKETKSVTPAELQCAEKLRKSIVFSRDLPAGHVLEEADLAFKCPGSGVSPLMLDRVVGSILKKGVRIDTPFDWDMALPAGDDVVDKAVP
jgi:sialic acid synthase SpsE